MYSVAVIVAGIHHLILSQNCLALVKTLIPEDIMSEMLEKGSPMEEYVLSTDSKEERIQRFIEYLKACSMDDYKNFMKLLYFTQQTALVTKMVASCKPNYI